MTAAPPAALHHEPDAHAIKEPCIARISLDCSACRQSLVYCHLSDATICAYTSRLGPPWVCPRCRGEGV